jgi:hypothetical protein
MQTPAQPGAVTNGRWFGRRALITALADALAALMALQSALGLVLPGQYRDVDWIRAAWFGNDGVTLLVAVPLLLIARAATGSGSIHARLGVLGVAAYAAYNYAFYLFGAALNSFFPLYVLSFVLSAALLSVGLVEEAPRLVAASCPAIRARIVGAFFMFVAIVLATVWLGIWGAHVFFGVPTPVPPDVFRLVAALDLSLLVPALLIGGALLWLRAPWGPTVGVIAGMQATLYLFVLTVNSMVAVRRGLVEWPGELLMWSVLFLAMAAATLFLAAGVLSAEATSPPPRGSEC